MDAKTYNEIFIESDERCLCPRCGVNYMKREPEKNALSRHEPDVYICSLCGTDEAVLDMFGEKMPSEKWSCNAW
ncbi:hypothetical protein [Enterococcus faecalis]|uniref:hypothetical protein n=1 Tax=Enterococcus faecalis TaxID=1351 RepID=UPI0018917EFF|nr:hypothetical protein [Enterococcus faecalis]QPB60523.1 hypothetical protein GFB65_10800 [Enterococcus faecalis]